MQEILVHYGFKKTLVKDPAFWQGGTLGEIQTTLMHLILARSCSSAHSWTKNVICLALLVFVLLGPPVRLPGMSPGLGPLRNKAAVYTSSLSDKI